jgi:hypothetical protein
MTFEGKKTLQVLYMQEVQHEISCPPLRLLMAELRYKGTGMGQWKECKYSFSLNSVVQ